MKRRHISYLVDLALFITLVLTVWSGFSMTSFKWSLFGLKYLQIFSLHTTASIIFTIFTGVHLSIHWELITEKTKKVLLGNHEHNLKLLKSKILSQ
jgi:hypothetical protein